MPWGQVSDVPESGGASSLRSRGPAVHFEAMVKHPANTAVPKVVDLDRVYEQILPKDVEAAQWPRATVRAVPGLASGELVWAAKIWEAPGVEARGANGLLIAFSKQSRDEVLDDAAKRVQELRWSKRGRLRLKEPPAEPEQPCQ